MKRRLILPPTFYHSTLFIYSQNITNLPTSMFGLGELSTGEDGQYAGLGGAGIALQNYSFLNTANSAPLTAIEGQRLLIDAELTGTYKIYTQTGTGNHSVVGNLNGPSIGCHLTPHWYRAVFVTLVSGMGYAIALSRDITGTGNSTVSSLFEGERELLKMDINTACRLSKDFSVSVNLSYATGTIRQTEAQGSLSVEESSYKHTFYIDSDVQYKSSLNKDKSIVAGLVHGYSQDLVQDNSLSMSSSSGSKSVDGSQRYVCQCLLQSTGAGLLYDGPRWMLMIEYKYTDWSRMESSKSNARFENQHRSSAGTTYTADNTYRNPVKLLPEVGVNNSYMVIQKKKIANYYISTRGSFTPHDGSALPLGVKYSDQLHLPNGMQWEQRLVLFLNLVFSERTYRTKMQWINHGTPLPTSKRIHRPKRR